MLPQSMFWSKNKKNIIFLPQKISILQLRKIPIILHGQVFFVMQVVKVIDLISLLLLNV